MNGILALSIRQPWAELILCGKKTIELRSWTTDYRGPLWVHTGIKSDPELEHAFGLKNLFKGGYVGIAVLTEVTPLDRATWELDRPKHLDPGDYQAGYFSWKLESPCRFIAPIPGPGKLGLYHPSANVEALLNIANK